MLLFKGDESSVYTLKKFSVTLSLTINRWPAAPTANVSASGRTVSFSGAAASDPDGDATRFMYRMQDLVTGETIDSYSTGVGLLGDWTSSTSFTYQVPIGWSGHQVQAAVYAWDGGCAHAECRVSGGNVGASFTVTNDPPGVPTLVSPADGLATHSLTQTLSANSVTDPNSVPPKPAGTANADPVSYAFFYCTTSACTTKNYLQGWTPSSGGTWTFTATFASPFYGQQLWWGVDAHDGKAVTASTLRSITFTNQPPTATNTSPVNSALLPLPNLTGQMPTLTARVADADDLTLNYRFELTSTGGSGILAASPWASVTQTSLGAGADVSFAVPAWLSSRSGYTWTVKVNDVGGAAGQSAPWTLRTQSRLGADSASPMHAAGPVQVNLATGNLFLAAGSAKSVATVGGPMSVNLAYNSQDQSGLGLRGTYCVDANGNDAPDPGEVKLVRTDSVPSFDWGLASPAESVPADGFKVRWEGTLRVPADGDWLFAGGHDDSVKITLTKNGGTPAVVYNRGCCSPLGDTAVFADATAITLARSDVVKVQIDYAEAVAPAFVEFRAKRTTTAEYPVDATWFTTSNDQPLPAGWTLSADSGLDPVWTRAEVNEDGVNVVAADGSEAVWTKDTKTVSGQSVTSWLAPPEVDDTLAVNADGTVTLLSGDGLTYRFSAAGALTDVTAAADDLKPAGAKRIYSPGTEPAAPARLVRLEDRLASSRAVVLRYQQAGLGPCPDGSALGFDAAPPAGMLCAIEYPDATSTRLYYSAGLLARISDPGDETTAAGASPAPKGRAVTDLVWTAGQLTDIVTPYDNDRLNAQSVTGSTVAAVRRRRARERRRHVRGPALGSGDRGWVRLGGNIGGGVVVEAVLRRPVHVERPRSARRTIHHGRRHRCAKELEPA